MSDKIIWEADVECTSCGGDGLYAGMCERNGAAVVCHRCKGTGKEHVRHEYKPFTERKKSTTVKRVFKTAGGYGISSEDVTTDEGKIIHFSQAGVEYKEWLKGKKPLPIYELHCPLQHFDQGTTIGEWLKDDGPCSTKLTLGGYIPTCSKEHREECWKWFKQSKHSKKY